MGIFFDLVSGLLGGGGAKDRYGHSRTGRGPKVKSGPTKGLTRARNKGGNWRKKHKFNA